MASAPDLPLGLNADKLSLSLEERAGGRIVVRWAGRSDARDPGKALEPFLARLLDNAEATRRTVELRFEKLEYFNSSTVGVLLRLLNSARERAIALELTYDAALRWQSVSFEALERTLRSAAGSPPATIRIRAVDRII